MGAAFTAERDEGAFEARVNVNRNGPVTGATVVVAVRDGDTANSWLDFADNTFKTVGWTTRQAAMTEVSAANAPGVYRRAIDFSAFTNLPAATDQLSIEFEVTSPANLPTDSDTVQLVESIKDIPTDVDTELSATHGAGSWVGTSAQDWTATERENIRQALGVDGTKTAGGTPGDLQDVLADTAAMQPLVDVAISTRSSHSAADVDTQLSGTHGAGSWVGTSAQDWTALERENIRQALGVDGTKTAGGTPGDLQDVLTDTAAMQPLVDVAISTRSSHSAADVDTQLSGTHGAGSWEGSNLLPYDGGIWIDTTNGSPGTTVGTNGTPSNPVDNIADAVTLAAATGFRRYFLKESTVALVLPSAHPNFEFVGLGTVLSVDINGQNIAGAVFRDVAIFGSMLCGGGITMIRGSVFGGSSGICGFFYNTTFSGTITVAGAGFGVNICNGCSADVAGPTFNMGSVVAPLQLSAWHGPVTVDAMAAGDTAFLDVQGELTLAAGNTAGSATVTGVGTLNDLSAGLTVDATGFLARDLLVDDMHTEDITAHVGVANSAAQHLRAASAHAGLNSVLDGGAGNANIPHTDGHPTQTRLRAFQDATTTGAATDGAADDADSEHLRIEALAGDAPTQIVTPPVNARDLRSFRRRNT